MYFYAIYVLSSYIFSLFRSEDLMLKVYKIALNSDDKDLEYRIWFDKSERVADVITESKMNENKDNIKLLNKKRKALEGLIKFTTDKKYVNKEIKKYKLTIKARYVFRKIFLFLKFLFFMTFQSLPILILVLTGNLGYAIIISGLVMVLYSLYLDIATRRSIAELFGVEISDEFMSDVSTKISIAFNSFIEQLFFYVLIFISYLL